MRPSVDRCSRSMAEFHAPGANGLPPGTREIVAPETVSAAFDRLAAALQPEVDRGECVLLAVMLGGLIPAARLAVRLGGPFELDYCHVTRYRGDLRGGEPEWLRPPSARMQGRTVVVVDDIFDAGITLDWVVQSCRAAGAARVVSAVLVRKRREGPVTGAPDFFGVEVPDRYVFGCGMDYRHAWRQLDAIYALPAEEG